MQHPTMYRSLLDLPAFFFHKSVIIARLIMMSSSNVRYSSWTFSCKVARIQQQNLDQKDGNAESVESRVDCHSMCMDLCIDGSSIITSINVMFSVLIRKISSSLSRAFRYLYNASFAKFTELFYYHSHQFK